MKVDLLDIYRRLYAHFGPQHWWPADTPFEMMVGAVLTQNTSWRNVELAIKSLKQKSLLTPGAIHRLPERVLAQLIRPAGFFNVKARRLKAMTAWIYNRYKDDFGDRMFNEKIELLRADLLKINGIGEETADSILLYAGAMPIFVVDAYTRRILLRHDLISDSDSYFSIQRLFMDRLPNQAPLFNEYHALIVRTAKIFCKKKPLCAACPLSCLLPSGTPPER